MSHGRAEKLKKLPRAVFPRGGAFRQGTTALILLLPSFVVVFGIVLYQAYGISRVRKPK